MTEVSRSSEGNILEMHGIAKRFPGVQALREVSFSCRRGEVHALVGENGAGKSTLIKILAGAYQPDAGEIVLKGERLRRLTPAEAQRRGVAVIYQEFSLVPYLTVAENLLLGREPRSALGLVDYRQLQRTAAEVLARLGVELDLSAEVAELSVAQQQLVEIARALSLRADIIVMDEPSAVLAGEELEHLFSVIRSLREQGMTLIYISHRLQEVFQIADRITVLKDGQVVGTVVPQQIDRARLIAMMVGRSIEETFPGATMQRGEPVLEVSGLSAASFLRDVSFRLHRGEVLGLAGLVGSGRTTLLRTLFGAEPLQGGLVKLRGQPWRPRSPRGALSAGVVLAPEDRKSQGLLLGRSVRDNMTLPIIDRLTSLGVIRRTGEQAAVQTMIRDLDIRPPRAEQDVQYLSGGNQQKVVLAKGLLAEPAVVLLDEPTRGIDVAAKMEVYQLIRRLADSGVGVLMVSSDLPEVLGLSDRILVMHEGRLMGQLERAEATEELVMALATGHRLHETEFTPLEA